MPRGAGPEGAPAQRTSDRAAGPLAAQYLLALRAADGTTAERIAVEALRNGLSPAAVLNRVLAPAMRDIGALWEEGRVGVADEHAATVITYRVLASIFARALRESPRRDERILLATVEGEPHSLGLQMAADLLELAGYRVVNLSADVPTAALLDALWRRRPHMLALSATLDEGPAGLDETVAAVREIAPELPIVLGGRAASAPPGDANACFVSNLEQLAPTVAGVLGSQRQRRPAISRPAISQATNAPAARPPDVGATESAEQIAGLVRAKAREAVEYRRLAFHDALSGLPNRRALDDRFNALLAAAADSSPGTLMIVDIDRFKQVNDEFGHEAGDRALTTLADVLEQESRESDFAARLGGDEFAVLLPGADAEKAVHLGERIRAALAQHAADPRFTVSFGIAEIHGSKRATLVAADRALYEAKAAGRDRIRVADPIAEE